MSQYKAFLESPSLLELERFTKDEFKLKQMKIHAQNELALFQTQKEPEQSRIIQAEKEL